MWKAKGYSPLKDWSLMVETILVEINKLAKKLIQKWGQENAPPAAHLYSLDNRQGSGLHVIQKTFVGDFEVNIPIS
jgi:hypothetical protein